MHAITIASDAHGFKKDDIVPMINRCSIRGALFFTYFLSHEEPHSELLRISTQGV